MNKTNLYTLLALVALLLLASYVTTNKQGYIDANEERIARTTIERDVKMRVPTTTDSSAQSFEASPMLGELRDDLQQRIIKMNKQELEENEDWTISIVIEFATDTLPSLSEPEFLSQIAQVGIACDDERSMDLWQNTAENGRSQLWFYIYDMKHFSAPKAERGQEYLVEYEFEIENYSFLEDTLADMDFIPTTTTSPPHTQLFGRLARYLVQDDSHTVMSPYSPYKNMPSTKAFPVFTNEHAAEIYREQLSKKEETRQKAEQAAYDSYD